MTEPNSAIRLEIVVQPDQTALLAGLAAWQELGLLSDQEVRQLCRYYLTCPLPLPKQVAPRPGSDFAELPLASRPQRDRLRPPAPAAEPGWLAQRLQALMEEISIIWLLFLGVFLVVVSSGVLAASQWQTFSPTGQYLVLLAYTIAFWGTHVWTSRQPTLLLTTQMLRITTLLLIPINFWRMDAIALFQEPGGWAIAPLTTLGLSVLLVQGLRPTIEPPAQPRWVLVTALALSWLHWGWAWPGIPLLASYGSTVGSAALLTTQFPPNVPTPEEPSSGSGLSQPAIVIALSLLVLLVRALWVAQVPFAQLGLALGICGGLLCWQARRIPARRLWSWLGAGLLGLGWAVTLAADPPWQAIAISTIGLGLLLDRLIRSHRALELMALFWVGLQAYWLLGRLIPVATREQWLAWLVGQSGPGGMPWAALGLTLFPYVMGTVWLGHAYFHRSQPALGRTANGLGLGLASVLLWVSAPNPLMRSLTLTLALITLVLALRGRPARPGWVLYLVQGVGWGAIAAWIALAFPTLSGTTWSLFLLAAALLEWGICAVANGSQIQQSAWPIGLGLAGLGGLLFWNEAVLQPWGWLWLSVPLALTGLAYRPNFPPYRIAIGCSTGAAILVQWFTFEDDRTRLLGLGLMTGLLLLNTRRVPQPIQACAHVGLGLVLGGAMFWQVQQWIPLEWPLLLPLLIGPLWGLWHWQSRQNTAVSQVYAPMLQGWAIALSVSHFFILSLHIVGLLFGQTKALDPSSQFIAGIGLWMAAIAYRLKLHPTNGGYYSLAAAVELLLVTLVLRLSPPVDAGLMGLAIAHLALGLGTQVAGDLWVGRNPPTYRSSWHGIPLIYGFLGLLLGHGLAFSATTGLYTLGFALVGVGVGRRRPSLRGMLYLALLLITVGAYEALIYQLSQASGGEPGDGIILLAGLAALLGVGDRLFSRWLVPYLHLPPEILRRFALGHWILSSGLLLLSCCWSRSTSGGLGWIAIALILAADALWQGRTQENHTYAGIAMAVLAAMYGLWLAVPDADGLLAWGGAIATPIACAMHLAPWPRLGWSARPWQRSALILPLLLTLGLASWASIPARFVVAAFYAWAAKVRRQIRLSYISVLLADWAVVSWLHDAALTDPLWYAGLAGLSLLYLAQLDPGLQAASDRPTRHLLRMLAVGLIVLTSIYEAERGVGMAAIALGLDLLLVLAGLSLRVRAYLFVGTLAFLYQILRQLVLLIDTTPLLIWAVGIVLGLLFIWIAATFEARRAQIAELVRYWLAALEAWE